MGRRDSAPRIDPCAWNGRKAHNLDRGSDPRRPAQIPSRRDLVGIALVMAGTILRPSAEIVSKESEKVLATWRNNSYKP